MPLEIAVYSRSAGGNLIETHRERVQDNRRAQVFAFDVASEPAAVSVDPDRHILRSDDIPSVVRPLPSQPTIVEIGPNPTGRRLELQVLLDRSTPVDFEVFDVAGRRIVTQTIPSAAQGVQFASLDTSSLGSGMYFLRVVTNHGSARARFVVLH
jgi:hypothetical protein